MFFVEGIRVSDTWENSLKLFNNSDITIRFDSQRGPCVEIPNVVLSISRPESANWHISSIYPTEYKSFIDTYSDSFIFTPDSLDTTAGKRLYFWSNHKESTTVNQVKRAIEIICKGEDTRFNIINFWDPTIDPYINNPVSPVCCNIRVRDGMLNISFVVRSVDAWLGALPMLIAVSKFSSYIATSSGCKLGSMSVLIFSYHLYEMDIPVVLSEG